MPDSPDEPKSDGYYKYRPSAALQLFQHVGRLFAKGFSFRKDR